jgi:hypothetical protein
VYLYFNIDSLFYDIEFLNKKESKVIFKREFIDKAILKGSLVL